MTTTRLRNGTYRTAAGSTLAVSGKHSGIFEVSFDWFEEDDACCDCEVGAEPVDGRLTWACSECGGGSAALEPVDVPGLVTHPAKFSPELIKPMADFLRGCRIILDCCAGTGKLVEILDHGVDAELILNEIEPEWAEMARARCAGRAVTVIVGDARCLPLADGSVDGIGVSFTYGNRMADTFTDHTKRITYTAALGRTLSPGSTGDEGFGPEFRQSHREILAECVRVSRRGAKFVLNMSNHIADGVEVDVTGWFIRCLESFGYVQRDRVDVTTKRNGFGVNREARVEFESVILFTLDGEPKPYADLGVDLEVSPGVVQLGFFGDGVTP